MEIDFNRRYLEMMIESEERAILREAKVIRHILDGVEARMKKGTVLNDLGEIQGAAALYDTAVARYATLKNVSRELK